ncbi:unnamed protein product [Didymodactylos carnosus]|uniref:Uncharacterized protein n=1 Tax=Didymodactylos carnosus TaxID=1234261 RepID=A0A815SR63_9BILA|nr:unnamed protein product [Didymodactylos carnosus]CAF4357773.1 unnamed protein product [Didymodactylos carnosus]
MSVPYADELAKYIDSEASSVTITPNLDLFSPNSSQLHLTDEEDENILVQPKCNQIVILVPVNNTDSPVTVSSQSITLVGDKIPISASSAVLNTNNITLTFPIWITSDRSNSATATTTVHTASVSALAPLCTVLTTNTGCVQKSSISSQTETIVEEEENVNNQRRNSSLQSRIISTTNNTLMWDGVACQTDMSLDMSNEAV